MLRLICPLCRLPLHSGSSPWHCERGHSFDVAREGYVNLLLVQQKKSLAPGDNTEMVRARREFLAAGHYQPLRTAAQALLQPLQPATLLDLGCGEGYYTQTLATLSQHTVGLDIARDAVRLAARAHPGITWLVASGALLPLADQSIDVVCSLFSPLPASEMARVLSDHGHLLVVTPAADHLWSLRAGLFGEVRAHEPDKFIAGLAEQFELEQRQECRFALSLDNTALRQLLLMTPYVWKARPERRQALEAEAGLATEAAFTLLLFRKKPMANPAAAAVSL